MSKVKPSLEKNVTEVQEDEVNGSGSNSASVVEIDDEKKPKLSQIILREGASEISEKLYSDELLLYVVEKMGYQKCPEEIPPQISYIAYKANQLSNEESIKILKEAAAYYKKDPNIPAFEYDEICRLSENSEIELSDDKRALETKALAGLIHFHSPYKEVRAVVDPTDDPTIPVETFRAYFFALIWAIVGSGFNEFFSHRQVSISINTSVVQMLLYPCGTLWAKYMPCWGVTIGGRKYAININKPWTQKEQMFATLLYAICGGTFYTHYNILTEKVFYDRRLSFGYQFWLSLSVQFIGFGFAGILRNFVVYPARALWPTTMTTIALNKALMAKEERHGKEISRYWFFFLAMAAMFVWTWFPTYIINIFNTFNWMTWIAPNNFNLAAITGGVSGLGFNPITSFDWNVIGNISPLVVPFWSNLTQYVGTVFAALVVIAVYWTNYKDCQYLPIFSNYLFTNKGTTYSVISVLNSEYKLDETKYQQYSPPYYSAGNLVAYGSFIAAYPMLIAYAIFTESEILLSACKHWVESIWSLRTKAAWARVFSSANNDLEKHNDPHSIMMRKYKEVPDWWYFTVLILAIIVGICVLEKYDTNTPIWSLFMSIGLNFVFLIPLTILQATTGFSFGLNLLIEVIAGYALPGNPIALMLIKAFGYNIDGQADSYVSNLKLGHYCKIPPVALFRGQMFMVFIQIFVNLGVLNWQYYNIKGFCTPHQKAKFSCPDIVTYYNASVVWGALGPKRIFNFIYPILKYCWLIGALLGIFFGAWKRWGGKYYPIWFNPVLFVGGMISLSPPYGLMYFTPGIFVSFFSQYYMKKYHLRIWEKYNYVLDSAFTTGLVLSSIIIFFAVQYEGTNLNWWGNKVPYAGLDGAGIALKNITDTPKGYFGPDPGHFP